MSWWVIAVTLEGIAPSVEALGDVSPRVMPEGRRGRRLRADMRKRQREAKAMASLPSKDWDLTGFAVVLPQLAEVKSGLPPFDVVNSTG